MVFLTLVLGMCAMLLSFTGWATPARGLLVCNAGVVVVWKVWSMIRELRRGHLGLDLLPLQWQSVATLLVSEFWAAWIIALMITSGAALEDYANSRARRDLGALLDRAPRVAHRVAADGTCVDVPAADVVVGDLVVVRPERSCRWDGTVVDAAASFDESSTTGEPPARAAGGGRCRPVRSRRRTTCMPGPRCGVRGGQPVPADRRPGCRRGREPLAHGPARRSLCRALHPRGSAHRRARVVAVG